MAFDPAPSSWIASWSEDGTNVTFPLASVPQFTAAEGDGTTGDWRACFFRMLDHTYDYLDGLATADKPSKISITRVLNGNADGTLNYSYNITVRNDIDTNSVTAE